MTDDLRTSGSDVNFWSNVPASAKVPRRRSLPLLVPLVAVIVLVAAYRIYMFQGMLGLVVAAGVASVLLVATMLSLRHVETAILIWLISVLGFRNSFIIPTPGLPDLTLDRILLLWAMSIFVIKWVAEGRRVERPVLPEALVIIHAIYLLGSCLISNPQAVNLWTRSYFMPTVAFLFGKYVLRDERWLMKTLWILILVSFYHSVTAVAEHFHFDPLIWPKSIYTMQKTYAGRAVGIFGNPGVLGVFLAMALPFQLLLFLRARSLGAKLFMVVAIGLGIIGLYFTYTRGPWLAAAAGLIVLAWLGWEQYGKRMIPIGVLALMLGFTGLLGVGQDKFLQTRMGTEHTITGRINAWGTAYRIWLDYPLFGSGFRTYADHRADYRQTMEVPYFGLIKSQFDSRGSLHDIYVGQLAEEGVVGFGMQVWIYILFIQTVWRLRKAYRPARTFLAYAAIPCFGALMAAYFAGGLAFDYRFFSSLNSVFYLFSGVIVGWSSLHLQGKLQVFSQKV